MLRILFCLMFVFVCTLMLGCVVQHKTGSGSDVYGQRNYVLHSEIEQDRKAKLQAKYNMYFNELQCEETVCGKQLAMEMQQSFRSWP